MFPKQALSNIPRYRHLSVVGIALLLGACATREPANRSVAVGAPAEPVTAAAEPLPQTTTEAAVAAAAGRDPTAAPAAVATELPALNPDAPAEYVVKRGDTLWDISALFLRDPWRWPEIWRANPQIENPDLIYPGDLLSLVPGAAGGAPELRLTRRGGAGGAGAAGRGDTLRLAPLLRDSEGEGPIATIPYSAVAAFLERPSILSREAIRRAPRVIGFVDGHMAGGGGSQAYVRRLGRVEQGQRYNVVHVGEEIRDPDTNAVLGYQGIYTATAIVEQSGDPSRVLLADAARETLPGDRLVDSERNIPLNFVPRAPSRPIEGRIVSVVDGVELIGQYQVVAINRGKKHGLEPGDALGVFYRGEEIHDRFKRLDWAAFTTNYSKVRLPDERSATVLVFAVHNRVSYALVVESSQVINRGDFVAHPLYGHKDAGMRDFVR